MNIAFFDFDGTITRGDSFKLFLKFMLGSRAFYLLTLRSIFTLISYKIGLISNNKAKQIVLSRAFKGMDFNEFDKKCEQFKDVVLGICKKSALEKIAWHKDRGDEVVMVSASFEEYLRYVCKHLDIKLLATSMEVKDLKLSGRFKNDNCYGEEKLRRIKQSYDILKYDKIYAYGDTKGDKQMLELASKDLSFYRVFN